ncbi:MAG: right-handed parallel beta-helix repeat-containing protein [Actinomycetota bacterium]|nr:right-handed parallel beta-helix repeat-containing protein [Actinomycetota bacterium]
MGTLTRACIAAGFVIGVLAWGLAGPATGSAATVECGEVLLTDTVVENDLTDCPADGLVIGAPDINVDLNNHTIDGATVFCDEVPCTPRSQGIDNREGHDGVTIENGTVTGFHDGVRLVNADGNTLEALTVRAFAAQPNDNRFRAVTLVGSHDNQIRDLEAEGGTGLLLSGSDRNLVSGSDVAGRGDASAGANGIQLVEGSDFNVIEQTVVTGDGEEIGTVVLGSSDNEIRDSQLNPGLDAALLVGESSNTTITGNELNSTVLSLASNGTRLARNTLSGSVDTRRLVVTGSSNVISRNDIGAPGTCRAVEVLDGDLNIVRRNYVAGSVNAESRNSLIQGNYMTDAGCGRSGLYAGPSTVVKRNIAVHNSGRGIEASRRAVDAGGNRASFNEKRPKCLNIRCRPAPDCPGFAIGNGAFESCDAQPRGRRGR